MQEISKGNNCQFLDVLLLEGCKQFWCIIMQSCNCSLLKRKQLPLCQHWIYFFSRHYLWLQLWGLLGVESCQGILVFLQFDPIEILTDSSGQHGAETHYYSLFWWPLLFAFHLPNNVLWYVTRHLILNVWKRTLSW